MARYPDHEVSGLFRQVAATLLPMAPDEPHPPAPPDAGADQTRVEPVRGRQACSDRRCPRSRARASSRAATPACGHAAVRDREPLGAAGQPRASGHGAVRDRAHRGRPEQAFLGALAEGRTPPRRARLQDINRSAERWADLVPQDPGLRAAVLARIADKYGLPREASDVRRVLGADDPEVQAAFLRQEGHTIASLAEVRPPLRERLRWARTRAADRIEALPPFWLAYALTLTETVGGGILALPIALAAFGPVGATLALVFFGAVNTLTVAALVEAITRNGNMRYGSAFFGRLIGDYLGRPGERGRDAGPVRARRRRLQRRPGGLRHHHRGGHRPARHRLRVRALRRHARDPVARQPRRHGGPCRGGRPAQHRADLHALHPRARQRAAGCAGRCRTRAHA